MECTLSSVAQPLEVEPQLEDGRVEEVALEAPLVAELPLPVDDLEGDVLVGRRGGDAEHGELPVVAARRQRVGRRQALVYEVREEDVELVALHHLGRRVLDVVVGLVVLVPLEARVHPVEVPRLPRPVGISSNLNGIGIFCSLNNLVVQM